MESKNSLQSDSFTWLVVKEAALTQENLMKKGIQMCPRCFFCEQKAETINHLFLHCKVVANYGTCLLISEA